MLRPFDSGLVVLRWSAKPPALATARKMERSGMGSREMSRAEGKNCAISAAVESLCALWTKRTTQSTFALAAMWAEDLPAAARDRERDGNFAETVGEDGHFFRKEQAALFEIADVAGEAFDFGEVVRGEKDGGFGCALDEAFDELVADQWIEAGERLVEDDESGR